jgi:hypothetical protein
MSDLTTDIYDLFYVQGEKANADHDNKLREQLLVNMIENPISFLNKYKTHKKYNEIKEICDNLNTIINSKCNDYDKLVVTRKGKKQDHFDILVIFNKGTKQVRKLEIEYKHNAIGFNNIPQIL